MLFLQPEIRILHRLADSEDEIVRLPHTPTSSEPKSHPRDYSVVGARFANPSPSPASTLASRLDCVIFLLLSYCAWRYSYRADCLRNKAEHQFFESIVILDIETKSALFYSTAAQRRPCFAFLRLTKCQSLIPENNQTVGARLLPRPKLFSPATLNSATSSYPISHAQHCASHTSTIAPLVPTVTRTKSTIPTKSGSAGPRPSPKFPPIAASATPTTATGVTASWSVNGFWNHDSGLTFHYSRYTESSSLTVGEAHQAHRYLGDPVANWTGRKTLCDSQRLQSLFTHLYL